MENTEKIKKKMEALMRHRDSANSIGNLEEAEAFAQKIQELSLKYGIEISKLSTEEQDGFNNPQGTIVDLALYMRRHESDWIMKLFSAAAVGNLCQPIILKRGPRTMVDIIGMPHNIEIAIYTAESLIPTLRELAKKGFKEYQGPDLRNSFIRSFLLGAVIAIRKRLTSELESAARENNQVHGLIRTTEVAVSEFLNKKYPKLERMKPRKLGSNAGLRAGHEAGQKVGLNKGVRAGASSTKLLGS